MTELQQISKLMASNHLDMALKVADGYVDTHPGDADALFLRGKIKWRLGMRAAATNDFLASSQLKPDGPARRALELSQDIDSFFNTDLYNP